MNLSGSVAGSFSFQRIAYVVDSVIQWCALGLIPLVAIPQGAEKMWWQAAFVCSVFSLGALWIANGFLRGNWPLREARVFVPLLVLTAFAIFQTIPLLHESGGLLQANVRQSISADRSGTYRFVAELLALIVLGKLLMDFARERRRLTWLVYVVIGVSVASAAFGMIRLMVQSASPDLVIFGQSRGVGFAQFANQNHFALMMEMAMGLGLGLAMVPGSNRQLLPLHLGLVLLLAATIIFTTSRGGVFAMISQILFLAAWFAVQQWRDSARLRRSEALSARQHVTRLVLSLVLIFSLVTVVVLGIVNLGGEKLAGRMDELPAEWGNSEDSTAEERGDIWRDTWRLIKAHPLAGIGFGAYETAIPKYQEASGTAKPSSALNEYLNLLAGGGAIGAALAIWFLIILILRIRERVKSNVHFQRRATLGVLAGLVGVAVHSLVDAGLQVPINAVIFFALIVIATSHAGTRVYSFRAKDKEDVRSAARLCP